MAQLYHAYKDNEYNIIGCGNYGSIYKKKASSDDSGANDSAGILGNITNYEMAAGQMQQILIDDAAVLIDGYYNSSMIYSKNVGYAHIHTADYYWLTTEITPAE